MPYVWNDTVPVRSYLIPISDMTLDDRKATRVIVDTNLAETAVEREKIKARYEDLVIRDIEPVADLGMAATDDWLIAGLGVAATELVYVNAALAVNRCASFYGVSYESPAQSLSRIRFSLTATGANRGRFRLEQLYSRLEPAAYFSDQPMFVPNDTITVSVMPRIAFAANTERVTLLGRVIEPLDILVGRPAF